MVVIFQYDRVLQNFEQHKFPLDNDVDNDEIFYEDHLNFILSTKFRLKHVPLVHQKLWIDFYVFLHLCQFFQEQPR